jgi:hypothetical protein
MKCLKFCNNRTKFNENRHSNSAAIILQIIFVVGPLIDGSTIAADRET